MNIKDGNTDQFLSAEARATSIPIENPSIALYRDFISMASFQIYKDCEVLAIPAKYRYTPCGFALQKNSPYLQLFDYYLIEMRDKGMFQKILSKYEPGAQQCPDLNGLPIEFNMCFTAFLALLGGMSLGLILFIIEHFSVILFKTHIGILESYDKQNFRGNCQKILMEKEAIIRKLLNSQNT